MSGDHGVELGLDRLLERGAWPQSLLFCGGSETDTKELALRFAKKIVGKASCDLHLFLPEGKVAMHSMASMRALREVVASRPNSGAHQVVVVVDADRMLPTSANALLKTFEEPPPFSTILLTTSHKERILPTILSRCQHLSIPPEGTRREESLVARVLASLPARSYADLHSALFTLTEQIEGRQKEEEKRARKELVPEQFAELPASVRAHIELQLQGRVSQAVREQAERWIGDVVAWYRDLALLAAGGNSSQCVHGELVEEVSERFLRSNLVVDLHQVLVWARIANQSLLRSTPVRTIFETFFLRLGLIRLADH